MRGSSAKFDVAMGRRSRRCLLCPEQIPHAFYHAARDGPEIERLAAQTTQLGQGLGGAAAALALGQEPGVADRRARLRDQGLENLVFLVREVERLLAHEDEDTDYGVLIHDRQRIQAPEAVGRIPLARDHRRAAQIVGLDGLVVQGDPAGDALTVAEPRVRVSSADRGVRARA